jgi:hypothetical protein
MFGSGASQKVLAGKLKSQDRGPGDHDRIDAASHAWNAKLEEKTTAKPSKDRATSADY